MEQQMMKNSTQILRVKNHKIQRSSMSLFQRKIASQLCKKGVFFVFTELNKIFLKK
jgi:hypothetical protein